ncbi:hypothetical protein NIES4074_59710 (plasmid) [Cylindrospermum sp. NIES-4074]|nr:hypothetical protein NIES4074_59710 [Cylindrospermum sp. NIES-4074]
MVGSGKLGFSISPDKRQNKLWRPFSEESDIDIVVVSEKSFVKFWEELYNFNISLINRTEREERNYRKFLEKFFKGWLRPDLFPFKYSNRDKWLDFFRSISYKLGLTH